MGNDQSEVVAQVAHQAGAVGVVAEDAVGARRERVHRRSVRGPGRQLVRHVHRSDLVRQGDVQAPAALREERAHARVKLAGRHVVQAVADVLTALAGKHGVNERREAVTDRMADDPVLIQRALHQPDCDSIRALAPAQGPTARQDLSSGSQACRRSSVR